MPDSDYFKAMRNSCPDEESFQQEYIRVPAGDRSALITSRMMTACEYQADEQSSCELYDFSLKASDCVLGIDMARNHDLTVFWLLEKKGTTFAGNVMFAGDMGENGHANRSWAFALAIQTVNVGKRQSVLHFERIAKKQREMNGYENGITHFSDSSKQFDAARFHRIQTLTPD
jgi:phage FluMu gp28-like protein